MTVLLLGSGLIAATAPVGFELALASHGEIMNAVLDHPRYGMGAVWDGSYAYLFNQNRVLRYEPATDTLAVMDADAGGTGRMHGNSAVWDGTHAYIFGGRGGPASDEIRRYDPATDTYTIMGATLPTPRWFTSAVWDGSHAYVFGGGLTVDVGPAVDTNQIVRYDPASDTVTVMGATLPTARTVTSAVWDGSRAYVFGGLADTPLGQEYLDEIVSYDPATDTVTVMNAVLPTARSATGAVWDGSHAYVFGGGLGASRQIIRYDTGTDTIAISDGRLPRGLGYASAVWDGSSSFLFGGIVNFGGQDTDQILRVNIHHPNAVVAPVPPADCINGRASVVLDGSGSSDPDGDPLTFSWDAPGIVFDDPTSPRPSASFPLGSTPVTLTVSDGGLNGRAVADVNVVDRIDPIVDVTRPTGGYSYVLDSPVHHGLEAMPIAAVGPLTFEAEAADECGVVSVTFLAKYRESFISFVDDTPPYEFTSGSSTALGTALDSGPVRVSVLPLDLGGNSATERVEFLQIHTYPGPNNIFPLERVP